MIKHIKRETLHFLHSIISIFIYLGIISLILPFIFSLPFWINPGLYQMIDLEKFTTIQNNCLLILLIAYFFYFIYQYIQKSYLTKNNCSLLLAPLPIYKVLVIILISLLIPSFIVAIAYYIGRIISLGIFCLLHQNIFFIFQNAFLPFCNWTIIIDIILIILSIIFIVSCILCSMALANISSFKSNHSLFSILFILISSGFFMVLNYLIALPLETRSLKEIVVCLLLLSESGYASYLTNYLFNNKIDV